MSLAIDCPLSRRKILTPLLACLVLCLTFSGSACTRKRRSNPDQSVAVSHVGVGVVPSQLEMRDPAAASQLLTGFYKTEASWRWTAGQFSVLLGIPKGAAVSGGVLKLHFAIPQVVLDKLHQQTLSASIHGKPLGPETYTTQGAQTYSRPIPAELLTGQGVEIDFTVDPVLPPSSADMRELAVIASSISLEAK
jgi:hypothetical protein